MLTWSALHALAQQRALAERVAQAAAAQREGLETLASVRRIEAMRLSVLMAQSREDLDATGGALTESAAAAAADVGSMGRLSDDDLARDLSSHAAQSLARFVDAVRHAIQLRGAMLHLRDDGFFASLTEFALAMHALREALAASGLPAADQVGLGRQLNQYQEAVFADRDNAETFLLTGYPGLTNVDAAVRPVMAAAAHAVQGAALPEPVRRSAAQVFAAGDKVLASAAVLFDADSDPRNFLEDEAEAAAADLDLKLRTAVQKFEAMQRDTAAEAGRDQLRDRRRMVALAAGALAVLIGSSIFTARAVARPAASMTRAVQRMAAGDTATAIGFAGRHDEMGRMAAALEVLRRAVRQAHVQAQMIAQLPLGVMTCAAADGLPITYLNAEARRLLELVEAELPSSVEALLGVSADAFFADPLPREAVHADPLSLPQRLCIRIGPETFELTVSALRDDAGAYAGPMLNWRLLTQQVRLSDTFERSIAGIAQSVGQAAAIMEGTADAMSGSTAGSAARLAEVAGASEAANGSVQAVAANAERLAASVAEITRQVGESAAIVAAAVAEAEATDHCVTGLSEAASRIGDVVRLIGDIAGRTNLLALNATIEAARAGDAGRGFAVVAAEVKTLANQTARATQDVAAQITAMQGATGQAVAALRSIAGTIARMNEIAAAIAAAVEQQGAATHAIARSVHLVAQGTARVDGNICALNEAVQTTGSHALQVQSAARALSEQAASLGRQVGGFLAEMRAAA